MSGVRSRGEYRKLFSKPVWLGLLVLVFFAMAVMAGRDVGEWERSIFEAIYGASESWRTVALVVTQTGSAWFWLALTALFFIIRRRPGTALGLLISGAAAYIAVLALKLIIARPRPELLLHDVAPREILTFGLGFPSAHVTIATVMALTLRAFFSGIWRWVIPIVWIGGVAWSRLYLGVHAPLDILGGVVLGVIVVLSVSVLPQRGMWKK